MLKKIFGIILFILLLADMFPVVMSFKDINSTVRFCSNTVIIQNWTEEQKLLALDGEEGDCFGGRVALSGDTALIGAPYDNNDNGHWSGSAYVFIRTGNIWTQQSKLLASDGSPYDFFGFYVSISGDTALIGAYWDDDKGKNSGSAYVFTRNGTIWTQQAKLLALDGEENDSFGYSVSISDNTALIGAPNDDNAQGSAYVFIRSGYNWTLQQKLLNPDSENEDYFGRSVTLEKNTALIGVPYHDDNKNDTGSAYVFTRTDTIWTLQAKLIPSQVTEEGYFGYSVSIFDDTVLIGAYGDDHYGKNSGSAYVFTRIGTTWIQQAKLLALDGEVYDCFGCSVSIYRDTALIGASYDTDNEILSGSAYIFIRGNNNWTQQQKLLASDAAANDQFGNCVYLSDYTALIGAVYNDDKGENSGSAYIFIKEQENQPPITPTITGPIKGIPGEEYTYCISPIVDPDGDNIYVYWDWDDGTTSGWLGPYLSGQEICENHSWDTKGTYTIRAKLKDTNGAESEWGILTISIPRTRVTMNSLYLNLVEKISILKQFQNRLEQ